jgi:subtilisin
MSASMQSSLDKFLDVNFYRRNNPDLATFNNQQALAHWKSYGLSEGRVFSPFIDLKFYHQNNPDLAGLTNPQLLNHLANFGLNEGRVFSPFIDLKFYRQNNPDLNGMDNSQLFDHMVKYGIKEGRLFSRSIDINFYRQQNPDLAAFDNMELWEHFRQYGYLEGRLASPLSPGLISPSAPITANPVTPSSPLSSPFNRSFGYGLVDAGAAVASAIGQKPFSAVPDRGIANWNIDRVNAPEAWNRGYTGSGIVVAVIDSGVDYKHPDLDSNIWINFKEIAGNGKDDDGNGYVDDVRGWDFIGNDNNPIDLDGHGTHIAGIIAAENNGIGTTGVAPNAKIMPIRALDALEGTTADVVAGIRYAANNGANVINVSIGRNFPSIELESAISYAVSKGSVVVFASGNDGDSVPDFPARYATNYGIAVGAIASDNQVANFSDRSGSRLIDYVVAPGVNVYSTLPNGQYGLNDGTSMAAPHVAGVAALILSANPNLSPAQVESIITTTANPNQVRDLTSSTAMSASAKFDSVTGSYIQAQSEILTSDNIGDRNLNPTNDMLIAGNLSMVTETSPQLATELPDFSGSRGNIADLKTSLDPLGNPLDFCETNASVLGVISSLEWAIAH